jgi:hypothetical protein
MTLGRVISPIDAKKTPMTEQDDRPTPVEGVPVTGQNFITLEHILETVHEVLNESRDIKRYSQSACESALKVVSRIPELEKRIDRIVLFQAWFPTALVTVAIIVRIVWLR